MRLQRYLAALCAIVTLFGPVLANAQQPGLNVPSAPNARRYLGLYAPGGGGGAATYLPGSPAAAWAMRRIVSGYSGFAARFTDGGGTRTIDIGFAAGSDSLDYTSLIAFNMPNPGTLTALYPTIVYDQTGNGRDLTALSFADNPTLQSSTISQIGSDYPVRMATSFSGAGATARIFVIPNTLTLNLTSGATFLMGMRPQSSLVRTMYFETGTGNSDIFDALTTAQQASSATTPTNSVLGIQGTTGTTNLGISGAINMPRAQPGVVALSQLGTAVTVYADERSFTFPAPSTVTTSTGGFIGNSKFAGFSVNNFDFLSAAAYGSVLNTANLAQAQAALVSAPRVSRQSLIYDGDSITQAIYATFGQNLAQQIEALGLSQPVDMWNLGVASQYASNISSTWAGRAGALPTSNLLGAYTKRIYHLWAGTNDIFVGSTTGSALFSALTSPGGALYQAHAAGMKVVVGTLLYEHGNTAGNTQVDAYNALVRASVGGGIVDAVADYQANSMMGPLSATGNTALYADGIHPTMLGYSYLAPVGQAAINSVQ